MKRVIMVTGAGRGIGREIAFRLSEKGDVVIVVDKDAERVDETARLIRQAGFVATASQADLTSVRDVSGLFKKTYEDNQRIDALVNNAGYYLPKPVEELDVEFWDLVVDSNLKTAFLCSLEAFKYMRIANYGKIVNITSSTVFHSSAALCPYISAKAGLIGLTRALAVDFGQNHITVNALAVGLTATEYTYKVMGQERFEKVRDRRAIKRDQTPSDLVGAISFLIDPASDFITGQTLSVDGGLTFT